MNCWRISLDRSLILDRSEMSLKSFHDRITSSVDILDLALSAGNAVDNVATPANGIYYM